MTTEELRILQLVVNRLSSKFYAPGYLPEDIKQEAFIIGIELLPKYDKTRGKLEHFLQVGISNGIKNFITSKTCNKKPCGCPENTYCSRCRYRESKARVMMASQFADDIDIYKDTSIKESLTDLLPLIDQKLPVSMRTDWRRILDGTHVVKSRKAEIFEEIREIVKEFEEGTIEENSKWEYGWENGYFFIEDNNHLAKLYMDEEACNVWLGNLSPEGRQIYLRLRDCGTVSYEDVLVLVKSIEKNSMWDVS